MAKQPIALEWSTVKCKVNELVPMTTNPRKISEQGRMKLIESLKRFNLVDLPVVDYDGTIVSGHQRLNALQAIGRGEEVIDVRMPNRLLTDKERREYNLLANTHYGAFDFEELEAFTEGLDLEGLGLDFDFSGMEDEAEAIAEPNMKGQPDNQKRSEKVEEDDFSPPEVEEVVTDIVEGDLFEIGPHRLLCGDSTREEDWEKLMNGESATLGFNDPPYGMKKEADGVLNDNLNFKDLLGFNKKWIAEQLKHLKPNGSWYCWGTDEPLMDIYSEILKPLIAQQLATFRNLITWNKGHGQGMNSDNTRSFAIADEKCLFIMLGVQGFNNNADNYFEGWEPIRSYLAEERRKSGLSSEEIRQVTNSNFERHSFNKSQWAMPTEESYKKMQAYCKGAAFKKEYEEIKKEYEEIKKEYYNTRAYFNNTHDTFNNVWHFPRHERDEGTGGHATPKPLPLCARGILCSSQEGDIVVDAFLGSGSTMVTSDKLGRKCYGLELSPKYCQVIINRMLKNNPTLKILKNGTPYPAE